MPSGRRGASHSSSSSDHTPPPSLSRRKNVVIAACEKCRKRKTKCDGARPCSNCAKRGEKCSYITGSESETHAQALKRKFSELQEQGSALRRLFELIRERPDEEARSILDVIRQGEEPQDVLRQVNHGDLLLQLHLVPETKYRFEFPHRQSMPAFLLKNHSPYLQSLILEAPYANAAGNGSEQTNKSMPHHLQELYLKPYHASHIAEPFLDDANISQWTSITTNEGLLLSLMEAFFQHKHAIFVHIHKDLFLQDLKAGRNRFCSKLLVNAILAAAYHAAPGLERRHEYWNPTTIGYLFLAEAKRLLELEIGKDKVTTVQALLVMNLQINEQALDTISYPYFVQAVEMSERLGLFGRPDTSLSQDWQTVRGFTGWAVFSWQSLMAHSTVTKPLLLDPPQTPLPDPSLQPSWYGELWLRYPSSPIMTASLHPQTIHAQLRLRVIMNDITICITSKAPNERISLYEISKFYTRLTAWFDELPPGLQAKRIVLPCQLILHNQYWTTVMGLFDNLDELEKGNLTLQGRRLSDIKSEARIQVELIVRMYYLRHGFEIYSPQIFYYLTTLSFLTIQELQNADEADADAIRSTLILASKGVSSQAKCYYMAEAMLRTICTRMDSKDVNILKQHTTFEDLDDPEVAAQRLRLVKTRWKFKVSSLEDPEQQQLWHVVEGDNDESTDEESSGGTEEGE